MSEYICSEVYFSMLIDNKRVTVTETDCKVKVTKPRNIKHHRLCFGMLNYTYKHMNERKGITTAYDLLLIFKDIYEYYTPIPTNKGVVKKYYSLSFESMGEDEFKPIAENLKAFCYATLNGDKRSKEVIQGLLDIEF
jgi:hypothetical protein